MFLWQRLTVVYKIYLQIFTQYKLISRESFTSSSLYAYIYTSGWYSFPCLSTFLGPPSNCIINKAKSPREKYFSGLYFPVFGLNTEIYEVNLCIQSKYRKIRTTKTPYLHIFHAVKCFTKSKNQESKSKNLSEIN